MSVVYAVQSTVTVDLVHCLTKTPLPFKRSCSCHRAKTMIPKVVYQTWKTRQLPLVSQYALKRMMRRNPGCSFKVLDDRDVLNFINSNFDGFALRTPPRPAVGDYS